MATPGDRKLDGLYAALTPSERARLIAKCWREGPPGEIARICAAISDPIAGAAYNRTVRILRALQGAAPMLHAIKLGLDKGTLIVAGAYDRAADRRNVLAYLARVWHLLSYPVTESEYRRIVEIERAEPVPVEEYLGFVCFDSNPARHVFRPDVAAIVADRRDGMTDAEEDALWRRCLACFRAAVKRGDLPKPTRRGGVAHLPRGVLSDWADGTTAETFVPFDPDYYVPEIALFGGGFAPWDVRPDAEAAAVGERRAAMSAVFASIVHDGGDVDASAVAALSLEPPATLAERARRREAAEAIWPWSMFDGVCGDLRTIAGTVAQFRAELDVHEAVIDRLQAEEFGGEDPLAPVVRELLGRARAASQNVEELWTAVTGELKPLERDATDWPPAIDDDAYRAEMLPHVEALLRGDWGD